MDYAYFNEGWFRLVYAEIVEVPTAYGIQPHGGGEILPIPAGLRQLCLETNIPITELEDEIPIDSMTVDRLIECIDDYNKTIKFENKMNFHLKKKKIRHTNFPSHISENIVKFAYNKIYGRIPTWDTDKGDLTIYAKNKLLRIEVKGSLNLISNSNNSFGPTEEWDNIYFVDGVQTSQKIYTLYEIKLPNKSELWKNIRMNKTQTYFDQCKQGKRPRITWKSLKNQLGAHIKCVFSGHILALK